jgi:hypothetical protein
VISIEVFAAKDNADLLKGVMLAVPDGCGLHRADTLRIIGSKVAVMGDRSVLPLDLPVFNEEALGYLREAARQGVIAVAEFTPLGISDSYLLRLEIADAVPQVGTSVR